LVPALGQVLTPEEIKRGGTGSKTNKAFDRYFQPQRDERIKVTKAIKVLRKEAGERQAYNNFIINHIPIYGIPKK
jgi:hypothetical protein